MRMRNRMTQAEKKAKERAYYQKNLLIIRTYQALYHYAFYESVRKPRPVPTAKQLEAARLRHNKYANTWYHALQAKRREARAAESARVKLLWAHVWPALVGLIAAAYREELDAHNARKKRQRSAKPDHYRAYHRQYSEKNREKLRAGWVDWNRRTRYEARRTAEAIANVSPRYVVKKLLDGTALKARDLPPALIEAKRQQLLLRRAIQQKTQT